MAVVSLLGEKILFDDTEIGYIKKQIAFVDADFFLPEVINFLRKEVKQTQWKECIRLQLEQKKVKEHGAKRCWVRVYQVKFSANAMKKFVSYTVLTQRFGGVDESDYIVVYDGESMLQNVEDIYNQLRESPPIEWSGHPITVSDLVEVYDECGSEIYYVNAFSLEKIKFRGANLHEKD